MTQYYITTPIYYVNDVPHIGHLYTTTVADVMARFRRLYGDDVFFLTGTDEHAAKVVDSALERGLSPEVWAERNAAAFRDCFAEFGLSNDDFIRTVEERHKSKVVVYVQQLLGSGDVYLGEYEGWYDAGQEEYVPEARARELDFKSAINKKPLIRKREQNFFFRLSRYAAPLLGLIESDELKVHPPARKQEVLARIRDGLKDVPISRTGGADWGIKVPGHDEHTIYVWIDALFNYLSTVDQDDRRHYWPADVHLIGKDILWFHAIIWPAMLMALKLVPGNDWMKPPRRVHAHGFWIREGEKMSKSMGNFVDLTELRAYVAQFGLDALRYYLVSSGPFGASDADFARSRFLETYNADLANTVGNCVSRVSNMLVRYFEGIVPEPTIAFDLVRATAESQAQNALRQGEDLQLDAMTVAALELVKIVDGFIQETEPFRLIKTEGKRDEVGSILYHAAEILRISSVLLWPVLPERMQLLWQRFGCQSYTDALADRGRGQLRQWLEWGGLAPGSRVEQGEPLFPRIYESVASD